MLFNTIDFAVFLPIVFILYWHVANKNLSLQNLLIVISSFIFYGWWDWRFLFLMVGSASVDFCVGILLSKQENTKKRKILLSFSIIANLGILAFFKYFNFFVDNFVEVFSIFGTKFNTITLQIVLPVGISFYTFQALSYTIDVYRKKIEPTKSVIDYFAFISFFPQLVAGPIERATQLLPQFQKKRIFSYENSTEGLRQILWGLFKKIVVADNCAEHVNIIFNNSHDQSAYILIIGAVFFAFQIYGDFSGYSDIAIGTAKLFGFTLMQNFAFPYFSRDIAEFWRRWHISLSTWFRDYLYIPLGGSRGNNFRKIRNIFIIFIVSGFWHGANWTFIVWGALNALYFIPLLLAKKNRNNIEAAAKGKFIPSFKEFIYILKTFSITVLAWIFFRANNIEHALSYLSGIFSKSLLSFPSGWVLRSTTFHPYTVINIIIALVVIEWIGREKTFALSNLNQIIKRNTLRWVIYFSITFAIFYFSNAKNQTFIYFQF